VLFLKEIFLLSAIIKIFNLGPLNSMIVASARGDVNGDGIPDNVYLTGIKENNIKLILNNITTPLLRRYISYLKVNKGYKTL